MDVFSLEELQNMSKDELIGIIGCYVSDQEIWSSGYQGLQKENTQLKAEIEQLTEELEKTKDNRDGWRNRAWNDEKVISQLTEKLDNTNAKLIEEYGKNAELQKQVDKLKTTQVIECYGMLKGCDILNQSVKDMAKEILQELYNQIDENTPQWVGEQIKIIAKHKGIEVE